MICRNCGAEIADKALICYRCGTATTEARLKPAKLPSRCGGLWQAVIALVILVIAGIYMGRAAYGQAPPIIGWVLLGLAVVLIVVRVIRRR